MGVVMSEAWFWGGLESLANGPAQWAVQCGPKGPVWVLLAVLNGGLGRVICQKCQSAPGSNAYANSLCPIPIVYTNNTFCRRN